MKTLVQFIIVIIGIIFALSVIDNRTEYVKECLKVKSADICSKEAKAIYTF